MGKKSKKKKESCVQAKSLVSYVTVEFCLPSCHVKKRKKEKYLPHAQRVSLI